MQFLETGSCAIFEYEGCDGVGVGFCVDCLGNGSGEGTTELRKFYLAFESSWGRGHEILVFVEDVCCLACGFCQ